MAVNLSPIWGAGAQLLDNSGNVLTGGKIYTYAAGTTIPATTYTSSNGNTANSNPIILNSAGRVPYEIWLTDGQNYKFVLKDSNDVLIGTWDNLSGINSNFIAYTNQQEIQTATAGQTVFTLTTMTYQPGTNSLSVFVDGINQYGPGAPYAYVETNDATVTFLSGLHVGAEVKFTTTQLQNASSIDSSQVTYTYPNVNAVQESVESRLAQYVSVKDFGAKGDGVTDDTVAITNCLDYCRNNNLTMSIPNGEYVVTSKIIRPVSYDIHDSEAYKPINIIGQSPNSYFKYTGSGEDCFDFSRSRFVSLQNLGSNKRLYTIAGNNVGLGIYQQVENINVRDCQDAQVFSFTNVITNPRAPSVSDPDPDQNRYQYPMVVYNNGLFNAFYVLNECIDENGDVLVQGVNGDFSQQSAFAITDKVPATSAPIILIENTNPIDCRPVFQFQTSQAGVLVAGYAPIAYQVSGSGHISIGCATVSGDTNAPGGATVKLRDNTPTINFYDAANSNVLSSISGTNGLIQSNNNFQIVNGDSRNIVALTNNGTPTTNTELGRLSFTNTLSGASDKRVAFIMAREGSNNNEALFEFWTTTGGSNVNTLTLYGVAAQPGTDNTISLGTSSNRWTQVYAVNGTINTSDANEKQDIAELDDAEKRVAVKIKKLIKKFRFKDAVVKKGESARIHVGAVAQEVRDAFTSEGLDASMYGIFCSDTWYEVNGEQVFADESGAYPSDATQKTRLGLRYDELLAFVIASI